jgi:hypothetical protein
MTYTHSAVTPHEFVERRSAAQSKRNWFGRFIDALVAANMRRVEREYGRYAHLGATLTDETERQIARRLNSTR